MATSGRDGRGRRLLELLRDLAWCECWDCRASRLGALRRLAGAMVVLALVGVRLIQR